MCGIVGYIGNKKAVPILIGGLKSLEYRGYDSAGVAALTGNDLYLLKRAGKLKILSDELNKQKPAGTVGIGHTRWATHGEPNEINSHPHCSYKNDFVVMVGGSGLYIDAVCNGIDELPDADENLIREVTF